MLCSLWGGMEEMHWFERFKASVGLSMALAVFVGVCEHMWLSATRTQPLAWLDAFALGLVLVGAMCVVALASSVLLLPNHLQSSGRGAAAPATMFVHVLFVGLCLCVWQAFHSVVSALIAGDYRIVAGFFLLAGLVGALLMRNLLVWVRALSKRRTIPASWALYGVLVSLVVLAASSTFWAYRGLGGGFALDDDRTVLLITMDGLDTKMGRPSSLGDDWTFFAQAVNPSPSQHSAHVSMFTGLHPLRHGVGVGPESNGVLAHEETVAQQVPILAEMLRAEGYTTGGFVSSGELTRQTSLARGFDTYDDDVDGGLAGLRLTSVSRWGRLLGEWMERDVSAPTRAVDVTSAAAVRWMEKADGFPWLLWVHLSASDSDVERVLEEAIAMTDAALADANNEVLVVWMGTPVANGEASPLSEARIRIPLFVHASWLDDPQAEVGAQVRPMDVYATVLDAVGVRATGPSEGVSLLPYMRGEDNASLWCSLVSKDEEGQWWFGLRNDRVKYVERPSGAHALYDLTVDPSAQTDVSSDQDSVVIRAQDILAPERKALQRWRDGT